MPQFPHLNTEMTAPTGWGGCREEIGQVEARSTRQAVGTSSTQLCLLSLGPLFHSLPSQPLFQPRCLQDVVQLIKAGPSEASARPTRP